MSDTETSEKTAALMQLAGVVAHELNNIFTAVAGNLSLIDHAATEKEEMVATIRDVVRAAQRGIDLTAKLQAFAGRQPLKRKRVDVNHAVASTIRGIERDELRAIDVRIRLVKSICAVFVDEEKFCDTIVELARNAKAAMPDGGTLDVETRIERGTNHSGFVALVRVCDTGRGMPEDVAARALDPLFTTKKQGINTGWGLSRCAGFIRQCGGRMSISSRVGLGTEVEIRLPLEVP